MPEAITGKVESWSRQRLWDSGRLLNGLLFLHLKRERSLHFHFANTEHSMQSDETFWRCWLKITVCWHMLPCSLVLRRDVKIIRCHIWDSSNFQWSCIWWISVFRHDAYAIEPRYRWRHWTVSLAQQEYRTGRSVMGTWLVSMLAHLPIRESLTPCITGTMYQKTDICYYINILDITINLRWK
jgi:hypothetical protein